MTQVKEEALALDILGEKKPRMRIRACAVVVRFHVTSACRVETEGTLSGLLVYRFRKVTSCYKRLPPPARRLLIESFYCIHVEEYNQPSVS